jgi:uncharacterized coiled-coil DUF342 family protein
MDFKEYTRKKAAEAIVSVARTGIDVTITYDEYDQDTGEKSVLEASLDLDQLREQRTQMNAQIRQDTDRLNALRSDRDDIAAMIADINAVVSS